MDALDVIAGCDEPYRDAVLYQYEYRRRRGDIRFYRQLVEQWLEPKDTILDLACGTGRLSLELARAGYGVIGLDRSIDMLALARQRAHHAGKRVAAHTGFFCGDMRAFALDRRFPAIVMCFNAFEHLYTRTDVEVCLSRIRDHLLPGGRFVFDVQQPDLRWLTRNSTKRWGRTRFTDPRSGRPTIYTTNHDYDPISQIVVIRLYYQDEEQPEQEHILRLSQRKFFPAEVEALIVANGFIVEARYGDFDGAPLDGDARQQVLVCRLPTRR